MANWIDWLKNENFDAFLLLQEYFHRAQMESVLAEIPYPKQLGPQVAFYSRGPNVCRSCYDDRRCSERPVDRRQVLQRCEDWISGDPNAPHFICQQPARIRLRLRSEPVAPSHIWMFVRDRQLPRLYDIEADRWPGGFSSRNVTKNELIRSLHNNHVHYRRSWKKDRLWQSLLKHE